MVEDYSFYDLKRQRNKNIAVLGIIVLIISILGTILGMFTEYMLLYVSSFISMYVGVGIIYLGSKINRKLSKKFKSEYLLNILKQSFESMKYNESELDFDEINNLVYSVVIRNANDIIDGTFKNTNFKTSDISIIMRRGNKRIKAKGMYLEIECSNSNDPVIVTNDRYFKISKEFKRINTEDADSERSFRVYSKSEYSYLKVLTSEMLLNIMKINDKYNGDFTIIFSNNIIKLIHHSGRDKFELSLWKQVNEETIKGFKNQVSFIKDLLESFVISY